MNQKADSTVNYDDAPIMQPVATPPATGNVAPESLCFTEDFALVDVETTGVDAAVDRIIEISIYRVRNGAVTVFHSLVNPEVSIPPTASAVNHITDEDVKDSPTFEMIADKVIDMLDGAYVVAHNATFDSSFVDGELGVDTNPTSWICSYRLARHLMPLAPAYGNQVLRYWLKTKPHSEGLGAHRAIDDVYVTLESLRHLLKIAQDRGIKTMGEVLNLSNEPLITTVMKFGEHVGKEFKNIPTRYFTFALGRIPGKKGMTLDDDLRISMERELAQPYRSESAIVASSTMEFGRLHLGKPMQDVPLSYLEWMENERPRCTDEVRVGVKIELDRRRNGSERPAPSAAATVVQSNPLTGQALSTFNSLAGIVEDGSDDKASLDAVAASSDSQRQFERYLNEFAITHPSDYVRVAHLTDRDSAAYMMQFIDRSNNLAPDRRPEPVGSASPGRKRLLSRAFQGEPACQGDGPSQFLERTLSTHASHTPTTASAPLKQGSYKFHSDHQFCAGSLALQGGEVERRACLPGR